MLIRWKIIEGDQAAGVIYVVNLVDLCFNDVLRWLVSW